MSRQLLNQALLSQIFYDLRNGQVRRCLEMGFTEEDLNILRDPNKLSMLLNTSARWNSVTVDRDVLTRLVERADDTEKETEIVTQMLLLGASSKMIEEIFSINPREVAIRKRVLNIDKKQGRWQELDDEKDHELYYAWKKKIQEHKLDTNDLMEMAKICMILANEHNLPMAMIWQAMEKWITVIK